VGVGKEDWADAEEIVVIAAPVAGVRGLVGAGGNGRVSGADEVPALRVLVVGERDELGELLSASGLVGAVRYAAGFVEAVFALGEEEVDVLLVDIALSALDRAAVLAAVVGRFACPPAVVFAADGTGWAAEAFEVGAVDYLVRPVSAGRLGESLRRIGLWRGMTVGRSGEWEAGAEGRARLAAVEVVGRVGGVEPSSVRWAQVCRDYVQVHTERGSALLAVSLGHLVEAWGPAGMLRIHRSYAVRAAAVTELRRSGGSYSVVVEGRELPVSRRLAGAVRDRLLGEARVARRRAV
jgi:DNA-binding LytR/AlgR family response regulator